MKLLSQAILLFFTISAFGQDKPLLNDDRGKLIYYEVVVLKDVSKDSLDVRLAVFLKSAAKSLKMKSTHVDSLVHASGKMIINKTALVLSRPSGEVLYNFYTETKDGKYRFWLTDFIFVPYQRDRYGNFVPSTTVGTPLETKPGKLNAAEWAGYIKATAKEANVLAVRFKEVMKNQAVTIAPAVKAVPFSPTQKW